ncbi:hypothetical protein DTL42_18490 [Bremerella cremea]|uniref:Uncharacterized protein n=1 Tax=Bremerella cremea TaxID=1031537 RepID=A0A368KQ06_9BACT|nr:hypothetical protein [Bremerella cremea]RCS43974.1 hypothetical protein DTL42_18490 [Bremerella cremea]
MTRRPTKPNDICKPARKKKGGCGPGDNEAQLDSYSAIVRDYRKRCQPSADKVLTFYRELPTLAEAIKKTAYAEHHAGKAYRIIPIFPELEPYQQDGCELLDDGQKHLINRYRDSNANLRTQFLRILRKASVQPWEKLFQNMRASRATELADEYPEHVATAWIGHSVKVARNHYWQVTDDHFAKALKRTDEPAKKAAQNPAQSVHAGSRNDSSKFDPRTKQSP